jgi:hypothetical protein
MMAERADSVNEQRTRVEDIRDAFVFVRPERSRKARSFRATLRAYRTKFYFGAASTLLLTGIELVSRRDGRD